MQVGPSEKSLGEDAFKAMLICCTASLIANHLDKIAVALYASHGINTLKDSGGAEHETVATIAIT